MKTKKCKMAGCTCEKELSALKSENKRLKQQIKDFDLTEKGVRDEMLIRRLRSSLAQAERVVEAARICLESGEGNAPWLILHKAIQEFDAALKEGEKK